MSEVEERVYAEYEKFLHGFHLSAEDMTHAIVESIEAFIGDTIEHILQGERSKIERLGDPNLEACLNGRATPLVTASHDFAAGAMTLADSFGVTYEKEGF